MNINKLFVRLHKESINSIVKLININKANTLRTLCLFHLINYYIRAMLNYSLPVNITISSELNLNPIE